MTEYFGLDEYTYNLLIEYFKSNPEIKIVRIFGSRILGSSRRCSDIDMFIEGTYSEDKVKIFNNELNCLRHPYRIDIISVNETEDIKKELVLRRLRQSKCFYLRKNYIDNELNEPYVNNFVDEFDNIDLWFYIFRCRFILNLEELYRLLNQINGQIKNNIFDIDLQLNFFRVFKQVFEGCWRTIKEYLKNDEVKLFLPRDIFVQAAKLDIIQDEKIWENMIIDFNIMTDEDIRFIKDELLYRLQYTYLPEIENLKKYFQIKFCEIHYDSKLFGIDNETYSLLIDYFKSKPKVKAATIYGSRTTEIARKSSNINLFIDGLCDEGEIVEMKTEINNLRHPYRINLVNFNTENGILKNFEDLNFNVGKNFYRRQDFYFNEIFEEYQDKGNKEKKEDTKQINTSAALSRYNKFCRLFEDMHSILDIVHKNQENRIEDTDLLVNLFRTFKNLFDESWKILKDCYKEQNIKLFLPVEIFKYGKETGWISDVKIWQCMIIDFNILTYEDIELVKDEFFYRLKEKYLPEIEKLNKNFKQKFEIEEA